jgi:hypothetical protein
MFIQPDWWEVTRAGVGTNRYGYSFGDPVNAADPGGNVCIPCVIVGIVIAIDKALTAKDVYDAGEAASDGDYERAATIRAEAAADAALGAIVPGGRTGSKILKRIVGGADELAPAATKITKEGSIVAKPVTQSAGGALQLSRARHNTELAKRVAELESEGYEVMTEVTFDAGDKTARIDLVAKKDGKFVFAEDIKTGSAPDYSRDQEACSARYPTGQRCLAALMQTDLGLNSGHL